VGATASVEKESGALKGSMPVGEEAKEIRSLLSDFRRDFRHGKKSGTTGKTRGGKTRSDK